MSEEPAVIAVVTFRVTKNTSNAELRGQIEQAGPHYINLPGLRRKYFVSADGVGGGIYEWASRREAEAFYDEAWHDDVVERFGNAPQVSFYEIAGMADGIEHRLNIYL